MAWTQTDLDDIRTAIKAKATGKRVTGSDAGGKDRSYADASLKDLVMLEARVAAAVEDSTAITGSRRQSTTVKSDTWSKDFP